MNLGQSHDMPLGHGQQLSRERSGYTYPMVRRTNMADANERDFRLGFLLAFISIYSEQNLKIMLLII